MEMSKRWRDARIVVALAGLAGCGARATTADPAAGASGPKPVTVTVAAVETRRVERTVEVVGSLKGWEDVTVGAKRTGRVIKVHHDMGDRVRPGEPLIDLEAFDAQLAVAQARSSLVAQLEQVGLREIPAGKFDESTVPAVAQARYVLEKARQNLNRERSLRQRGAGTAQDFQNAEIDERAAQAALDNAGLNVRTILANAQVSKAMLDVAGRQLVDMTIRAPIPSRPPVGTSAPIVYAIARRSAAEGQMLREGEAVAELVVENPLRLWTSVPERFSAEIRTGQEVRIAVASHPGRTFAGKVTRINPSVDPVSRAFQVESAVPNDDGLLRPGGFAKASVVTRRDDAATTVPIGSIVRSTGITKLFVVGDDLRAREVHVEIGREGKGWVEVVGAIPSQARVVATGQSQLADGLPVVVRDPEGANAARTPGSPG